MKMGTRGDKTLAELTQQHDVHPNQITDWKNQLLPKAADVFGGELCPDEPTVDLKMLHTKIGQLALENDFFGRHAHRGRHAERQAMIDRTFIASPKAVLHAQRHVGQSISTLRHQLNLALIARLGQCPCCGRASPNFLYGTVRLADRDR